MAQAKRSFWQIVARIFRHRLMDESDTHKAIPADMLQRLASRVAASEKRHSGEVRILCRGQPAHQLPVARCDHPRERALAMFGKLRVWDTEHNNGVLIYLHAHRARDRNRGRPGLHQHVSSAESGRPWCAELGAGAACEGRFEDGLTQALEEVSALLYGAFSAARG
jgi:uncharacterized membrane protein